MDGNGAGDGLSAFSMVDDDDEGELFAPIAADALGDEGAGVSAYERQPPQQKPETDAFGGTPVDVPALPQLQPVAPPAVAMQPPPGYPPPGMQMMPPGYGQPGMPMPVGVMPQEGSHMLGLSALAVGGGAVLGYRYGGLWGSFAGGLLGGAAVNAYRALYYYKEGSEEGDKEAAVSATYAALTAAVGGYLIATKKMVPVPDGATPNPPGGDDGRDEDEDEDEGVPPGPCAMRPAGPTILPPDEAWEAESEE